MKILMLHNYYRIRGGEDTFAEAEVELLREAGHTVDFLTVSNKSISHRSSLRAAIESVWSLKSYHRICKQLTKHQYDVMHVHNFFPQWSPSVFYAASRMRVPSVLTLHNYRLSCLNGLFFIRGKACTRCCASTFFMPGILRRCYRDSLPGSITVAIMLLAHRIRRTWHKKVSAFICPSEFVKDHFASNGLPQKKLHVIPHFVIPKCDPHPFEDRKGFVYVGRLSKEKGVIQLLKAWSGISVQLQSTLTIIGDGPLMNTVQEYALNDPSIKVTGHLAEKEVHEYISRSIALINPTQCYETFGLTIAEAFSLETPVIATKIGSAQILVKTSNAGVLIDIDCETDFKNEILTIIKKTDNWPQLSNNAKSFFENNLSRKTVELTLLQLYSQLRI